MSRLVVKVGGASVESAGRLVQELANAGHEIVAVHGAGPQISREMERLGLEVTFVAGRRYTTGAALEVVRRSLARVNDELCAAIGPCAVGLMGDEIGLSARQIPELGLVGDPEPSRPALVLSVLRQGLVPVVASLAKGPLNVNADEAAVALAAGLEAERVLFVTDVPGVLIGGDVVAALGADEADRLLGDGAFQGGIVPKLEAAVRAARLGMRAEIGQTEILAGAGTPSPETAG